MNKEQALGQLRAALTASGTVLTTWGVSDGNLWAPVIGVLLAGYSFTWGLLHHKDPSTSGGVSWSLLRKLVNAVGTALVTYGVLNPERLDAIAVLIAALGPLLASRYSWIDNKLPNDEPPSNPPAVLSLLLLLPLCVLLSSCSLPFTARIVYTDETTGGTAEMTATPGQRPTLTLDPFGTRSVEETK